MSFIHIYIAVLNNEDWTTFTRLQDVRYMAMGRIGPWNSAYTRMVPTVQIVLELQPHEI